jgi:hypothetical protein
MEGSILKDALLNQYPQFKAQVSPSILTIYLDK